MKKKKRIALALAAALMMVLLLAACSDKTIRLGVAGIGGVPAAVVQRVPADGGGTGGYGPGCLQPNRRFCGI